MTEYWTVGTGCIAARFDGELPPPGDDLVQPFRTPGAASPTLTLDIQSTSSGRSIRCGDSHVWEAKSDEELILQLVNALTHCFLVTLPDNSVVIHAAGLIRDREALVLFGPGDAGKTTAAGHLLRRGFRFLTDELVAFDPDSRRLIPFPRPLNVDPGDRLGPGLRSHRLTNTHGREFQCVMPPPQSIQSRPVRVVSLRFVELVRDGTGPRFDRLTSAEAVLRLFPHTLRPGPREALFRQLCRLGRENTTFCRLFYGEFSEAASLILPGITGAT